MRTIAISKIASLVLALMLLATLAQCTPAHGQQKLNEDQVKNLLTDLAAKASAAAVQQQGYTYAADIGTANAYAVTLSPTPSVTAGSVVIFKAANANTGASTLAVNGGSATAIKKQGSAALVSGDIVAGQIIAVVNDGTNWQIFAGSSSGSGSLTAPVLINTGSPTNVGLVIKGTSAGTGASPVQSAGAPFTTASLAQPFAGNVQVGSAILVAVSHDCFSGTLSSVSDSLGNTYTPLTSVSLGCPTMYIYAALNSPPGPDTVTVAFSGTGQHRADIAEYAGVASASALDVSATNTGGSGTSLSAGPVTTTVANDLLVSFLSANNFNSGSASGFTTRITTSDSGAGTNANVLADAQAATAGSYSSAWTGSWATGSPSAGVLLVALKSSPQSQTADLIQLEKFDGTVLSLANQLGQLVISNTSGTPTNVADKGTLAFDPSTGDLYGYGNSGWAVLNPASLGNATQLQGTAISSTPPTNGQVLAYNSSLSQYVPATPSSGSYTVATYTAIVPSNWTTFGSGGTRTNISGSLPAIEVIGKTGTQGVYGILHTVAAGDFSYDLMVYPAPTAGGGGSPQVSVGFTDGTKTQSISWTWNGAATPQNYVYITTSQAATLTGATYAGANGQVQTGAQATISSSMIGGPVPIRLTRVGTTLSGAISTNGGLTYTTVFTSTTVFLTASAIQVSVDPRGGADASRITLISSTLP